MYFLKEKYTDLVWSLRFHTEENEIKAFMTSRNTQWHCMVGSSMSRDLFLPRCRISVTWGNPAARQQRLCSFSVKSDGLLICFLLFFTPRLLLPFQNDLINLCSVYGKPFLWSFVKKKKKSLLNPSQQFISSLQAPYLFYILCILSVFY